MEKTNKKLKILDLFCKAGGASWGIYWVDPKNLEITGSDIETQPRYPFNFILSDFRNIKLDEYDFIWASN
jgi:DNA (cytosine-5)-methyltransferase 1